MARRSSKPAGAARRSRNMVINTGGRSSFPSPFSLPRRRVLPMLLLLACLCHHLTIGVEGFRVAAPPGRLAIGQATHRKMPANSQDDTLARTSRHWCNFPRGQSSFFDPQRRLPLHMTLDKLSDVQEETLLCVQMRWIASADLNPSETESLLLDYVRSFPFAAVLPVQPLTYLPTSNGVDVTFLRKKTADKPTNDGGIRFVLQPVAETIDGDSAAAPSTAATTTTTTKAWVLTARRNSEGQSVQKLFSEKLIVQEFLDGLTGASMRFAPPPTTSTSTSNTGPSSGSSGQEGGAPVRLLPRDVVQVTSVYHKWMSERR